MDNSDKMLTLKRPLKHLILLEIVDADKRVTENMTSLLIFPL